MKFIKYYILILLVTFFSSSVFASSLVVESKKQNYDDAKKLITLDKNVKVTIDDVSIKSPKAFLTINKEGKPDTATFVQGAHVVKVSKDSKSEIKAEILKLSLITKEAEATGNVSSKMQELGKPTVTIKSDYQSFNTDTNLMYAKNNVRMTYGDVKTKSNEARIWLTKKGSLDRLKLTGNATIIQEQVEVRGHDVTLDGNTEIMTATGSAFTEVKIDETTPIKIWAANQQFNNKTNSAMASGNVKVIYNDYVAVGPKAVLLADSRTNKPNKVMFAGRSKISEGDKSIQADIITMTIKPKNFTAEGNVRTEIKNLDNLDSGNKGI